MNTLYIVVGVPGCGKSTWCNAKIAANPNWLHISRDEVRFSMIKEEDDYFSKEKQVFNEYVRQIAEGLEYTNVIADATHLNEPSRLKLIRSIEKFGFKHVGTEVNRYNKLFFEFSKFQKIYGKE